MLRGVSSIPGWAAAAFLTLLGVPKETVKQDYLRSNDNILPMYDSLIKQFVANGGNPSIPQAVLGVKEEYLNAAFDEVNTKYGNIENYFSNTAFSIPTISCISSNISGVTNKPPAGAIFSPFIISI